MQKTRWYIAFLAAALMSGQTMVDLRTQSKSVDFSAANSTRPFKSGTLLPSICALGEMFFKTDAPAGANVYGCTALNSWVNESGSMLPAVFGNTGKLLSTDGSTFTWSSLGGDLNGSVGSAVVAQIQGRPVAALAPAAGQFLGWNSGTNRWEPLSVSGGSTLPSLAGNAGKLLLTDGSNTSWVNLGGDVVGQANSLLVQSVQGRSVAPTAPSSGQILTWNASANRWEPQNAPATGATSLAGDVTGPTGSTTVAQVQGRPVAPTAPSSGQILTWNATANRWEPQNAPATGATSLAGDVTGPTGSTIVAQVQGRSVAATAPSSGQILTWNATANRWEPQNAPATGATALAGDVTGPTGSTTVAQIQGRAVASVAPASGQFLGWNGTSNRWEPQTAPSGGGGSTLPSVAGQAWKVLVNDGVNTAWANLGGDVVGAAPYTLVGSIQGRAISPAAPASGTFLGWNDSANRWEPMTPAGGGGGGGTALPSASGNAGKTLSTDGTNLSWTGLGGDIGGQLAAATVTQIQGHAVAPTNPANGQVLSWNSGTNRWEPQAPTTGGGSGAGATMATQLGDFLTIKSSATALAVGANCNSSTPCNVRFGNVTYSFTGGANVNLSSGTGVIYIYVSAAGTLTVGHKLTLSCDGGCVAQSGVTSFPADSIPLFTWSATNGTWDALGADQRAMLSSKNLIAGPGIIATDDTQGHTTIAADSSVIGLRVATPALSSAGCSVGNWSTDASFYYLCVSSNTWRRAALASW